MDAADFRNMIEQLTGKSVADLGRQDEGGLQEDLLRDALKDDEQEVDCSQFNELLLLVNKDRVTTPFFEHFFGTSCRIKDLRTGVEDFQKTAMLCFGNFIYAYRILSKAQTLESLENLMGDYGRKVETLWRQFSERGQKILDITEVSKENTPLLGYISSGEIREEHRIVTMLVDELLPNSETWDDLLDALNAMKQGVQNDVVVVEKIIQLVRKSRGDPPDETFTLADLRRRLGQDKPKIGARYHTLQETEEIGNRNTDIYLSWDYMDVYFATSMRKPWEFEDLFDFISKLVKQPFSAERLPSQLRSVWGSLQGNSLQNLKVRYFDPTQSFDQNRINKGLIEALMLKRAACTVYSVQDTDTLGKDSELASTLAQGKPVIAYAPKIDVESRANRLFSEHPSNLKSRLQFVLYADERDLKPEETSFLLHFHSYLEDLEKNALWKSVPNVQAKQRFQEEFRDELKEFCEIVACSEQRIYNKRADTLLKDHPLAIQVNLDSGVANGILLVRDIQTCADLLLRILTNSMEFTIEDQEATRCWILKETLTNSVYRVVTKDKKLTNCFWNFYPLRPN